MIQVRTVVLMPLFLLACGAPPSAQPPGNAACETASTTAPIASSVSPAVRSSTTEPPSCEARGDCEPTDPCITKVCQENGGCESRPLLNGAACTPLEEYVEGDSYCYAGQCLSKRMCAKACLFDLVVAVKPEMEPMLAECVKSSNPTKFPDAYERCVSSSLEPHTKLAKRANRRIYECLLGCGYQPIMRDEDIEAYEGGN
jgi:hypothetical protein